MRVWKSYFPSFFFGLFDSDKQNWHNILCLNLDMIAVSSSESPAFEHCKYGVCKHYAGSQVSDHYAHWATCFIWPYLHLEILVKIDFNRIWASLIGF